MGACGRAGLKFGYVVKPGWQLVQIAPTATGAIADLEFEASPGGRGAKKVCQIINVNEMEGLCPSGKPRLVILITLTEPDLVRESFFSLLRRLAGVGYR
ncbi:hypothetical protein IF1G_07687 [Cordyceps javanica]|uniref:Uncharacterized protein n=1 Tax=Cordyceps javanica TaxID=43265 RepID=A0A545UWW1_9HYPO|nr:hypothetical protein IF1G_07687 [Cordyceps javanica]